MCKAKWSDLEKHLWREKERELAWIHLREHSYHHTKEGHSLSFLEDFADGTEKTTFGVWKKKSEFLSIASFLL